MKRKSIAILALALMAVSMAGNAIAGQPPGNPPSQIPGNTPAQPSGHPPGQAFGPIPATGSSAQELPEPSTLALLSLGLAGLMLTRRR